jgi:hypothetical protein
LAADRIRRQFDRQVERRAASAGLPAEILNNLQRPISGPLSFLTKINAAPLPGRKVVSYIETGGRYLWSAIRVLQFWARGSD